MMGGVEGMHSTMRGTAGRISLYRFGRRVTLPVPVMTTSAGRGRGCGGVGNGSEIVGCKVELKALTSSTLEGSMPMPDCACCYDGKIRICHYKAKSSCVTSILSLRHSRLAIGLFPIFHALRCSIRSVWAVLYITHCC